MSQRNRVSRKDDPDAQEEREIWSRITQEMQRLKILNNDIAKNKNRIEELEEICSSPDAKKEDIQELIETIETVRRQSEEEQISLTNLAENDLSILEGLRKATEQGLGGGGSMLRSKPTPSYAAAPSRDGTIKRKRNEAISADSPAHRSKTGRSMSVPNDGNNTILHIGSQVAFRLPKQKGAEGEWIQCNVMHIIGEGSKRKYDVQDPEPDETGHHGQVYRTTASQLISIPKDSTGLQTYPVGKQVLARYPETTTFYKAEVIGTKRDGTCRLRFEGEEEVGKETEVERRLVLEFGGK